MKLFIVRHGETRHNARHVYIGHTDSPLNPRGRRQARTIGRRLRQENIRCVYSSDLRRASEFASIAARNAPVKIMSDLREINFGIFEGLSHRQILKRYPRLYRAWLHDPQNTTLPQGEGLFSLRARVKKSLREIRARNKTGSVAVISHAGPIKIILKEFIPDATFWDIRVDNGSLSVIEYQNNKPRLLIRNDTSFFGGKP